MPRILDLRDNPHLFLLGNGALDSIAEGLEELRLPKNLRHLSFESIKSLPSLSIVRLEGYNDDDLDESREHVTNEKIGWDDMLNNVLLEPAGSYGDICCDRGPLVSLLEPAAGLTFCEMRVDVPGIDSVYDPFLLFLGARTLRRIRPRAAFMGEAAASSEFCAEYCAIQDGCKYFSYDARWKESEHTCFLLDNNGTSSVVECCNQDDYADPEAMLPGWTSGRPPRTRHAVDNAKVLIEPRQLIISEASDFKTHFDVSLGSTPLRGAVWVETKLATTNSKLAVSIKPERIVLYDDATVIKVNITVQNKEAVSRGETLVLTNYIQSCDRAYTAAAPDQMAELSTVYIDVLPEEDTNHISLALKVVGAVYVGLQGVFSGLSAVWTIYYREHGIVKKSQPVFLLLVLLGCFTISLSILPTMVEGKYRFEQNPISGEESENPNNDIHQADAACMAFPWLFNLGFIITFSSLFAKIWRIRRLLLHANSMRRATVKAKDVGGVMLIFVSIQFVILLSWQLVDPLRWEREVLRSNDRGFPLESIGYCTSDSALSFWIPVSVYNFICLLYALYLCYVTRHIPSDLNESKWVTVSIISIFQILLLSIPVLVIAWDDSNAFFFLRATVVFLISMGVTCFIFVPKVYHFYFVEESRTTGVYSWSSMRSSGSFPYPSTRTLPSNPSDIVNKNSGGDHPKISNEAPDAKKLPKVVETKAPLDDGEGTASATDN
jgi:hypothetical protein